MMTSSFLEKKSFFNDLFKKGNTATGAIVPRNLL